MSRSESSAPDPGAPTRGACDPEHGCITCSDEAEPMRVIEPRAGEALAVCVDAGGRRSEVMVDLVAPVETGDRLLVHAGAALARLGPA